MRGLLSLLGVLAVAMTVLADEALYRNITAQYTSQVKGQLARHTSGCTGYKVAVRKEWWSVHVYSWLSDANLRRGSLSRKQRLEYISAVKCLQTKGPKRPDLIPGSRSRFDDFSGVHIFQTFDIHFNVCAMTANDRCTADLRQARFLPWHRYFVWKYEKALREECGYKGYQP
jgi:tyrosinase